MSRSERTFIAVVIGGVVMGVVVAIGVLVASIVSEPEERPSPEAIAAALPAVDAYVAGEAADEYAGYFIDRRGVVRVGFTRERGRHLAALREAFAFPERIEVFEARHSLDELERLSARLGADMPALGRQLGVHTAGPDVVRNAVRVGVAEATPEVIAELRERYPATPIAVVEEPQPELLE